MAKIAPFRGLRYNTASVSLEEVVAPPYDVIGDEQRDFLYERHPQNIVRLERGKELPADNLQENKYTRARKDFEQWVQEGILRREEQPSIYIYEQEYRYSSETPKTRRGFMALARLEEQESRVILGHEQTLMPPKLDRLNLMKECKANLSPIFSLFSQPEGTIDKMLVEVASRQTPIADFSDDGGIRNRLWVVNDGIFIKSLIAHMRDKAIIIADGHHRYETALIYRHIKRSDKNSPADERPYDYVMMMFVNLDGGGVTIYPIHRIVHGISGFDPATFRRRIEEHFEITSYSFTCSDCEGVTDMLLADLARAGENTNAFGLYLGGDRFDLLKARDSGRLRGFVEDNHCESWKTLDVTIAQTVILQGILGIDTKNISKEEHVQYTPWGRTALEAVRHGEAQIALLLNPTRPEQVKSVTYAGEKMPQKSTFFYPKLLSGLVINQFD